jgi:hypothetical protein
LNYVNPNPKIISKEYQAGCIHKEFPLDSLFQFSIFYHGEKMWKILLNELVHESAVQGEFRLVLIRRSENIDKTLIQYTICCVRYKVYEKVPIANNFKGKHIGIDKLHADGIKKRPLKG